MKNAHRITGIIISLFIAIHLFNHTMAWYGIETHHKYLEAFRTVYRNPVVEIILIASFLFQGISGIKLFLQIRKKKGKTSYEKIQMYSGIIIALWLLLHITATLSQRLLHDLDTNFYFASRVVIQKPLLYFFAPYYFIGMVALGLHIANVHRHKISFKVGSKVSNIQFYTILSFFVVIALVILYSFMGGRFEIQIPTQYNVY